MENKLALMVEAEKRGILPESKKALLAEARKRGLVPQAKDANEIATSGMRDAVSESTFTVAGRSEAARGGEPIYAPEDTSKGEAPSLTKALLTNEPVEDLYNQTVRGLPSLVGGVVGSVIPGGTAPGAMGGEGVRQSAVGLYAKARGKEGPTLKEAGSRMAVEGALSLGGATLGKALPLVPKAAGKVYDYGAKNLGGMSEQTIQTIKGGASDVAKRVGITREAIGGLGEKARTAISAAVKKGDDFYKSVAENITKSGGPESNIRIDVKGAMSDGLDAIRKEFGYDAPIPGTPDAQKALGMVDQFGKKISKTIPGKAPTPGVERVSSPDEAREFFKFEKIISNLKEATPEQVYYLQKDINGAIARFKGTPLAAALRRMRDGVHEVIETNAADLPDLLKANRSYKASRELEEEASSLVNSEDAIKYIKNAFNPNKYESQKRGALEEMSELVPELGGIIKEVRLGTAAEEAGGLLRPLPQTGFGSAMLAGGGAAAAKLPAALALAPAFSPRAYLGGYQMMQSGAGKAIQRGVSAAYDSVPKWGFGAGAQAVGSPLVQSLLAPAQLSPNMQAVLEAANRR